MSIEFLHLDPYNPVKDVRDINLDVFENKNMSIEEQIKRTQAKQYWAEKWYPQITNYTPESLLIPITDYDIAKLYQMGGEELPLDSKYLSNKLQEQLQKAIDSEFCFLKSSSCSSHSRNKVTSLNDCVEELTNPRIIMSFKYGCRYIFMRKYITNMIIEYRCYTYQNKLRYIEEYSNETHYKYNFGELKELICDYINQVSKSLSYCDMTINIALLDNGNFTVIK